MISVEPCDVIQQFLADQSLVTKAGVLGDTWTADVWPCSTDHLPDDNDALYDRWVRVVGTGSDLTDGREGRSGAPGEKPTVQIMVRGIERQGSVKGYEIQDALRKVGVFSGDGLGRVVVAVGSKTVSFRAAHVQTAVTFLRDEEVNRRKVYVMNFKLDLWET